MRKLSLSAALVLPASLALAASLVHAQEGSPAMVEAAAPAKAPEAPAAGPVSLAPGADIEVTVTSPLKSGKAKVGHTFKIVTTADTLQDGLVVIPKGTEGLGRVTFSKGGGSFGKSGQMELAFTSLSLNGQTIPLEGKYREQASGNGGAATGAVLAAGLVGGFLVKGHSVHIAVGKVMHAQNAAVVTSSLAAPAPATPS